MFHCFYIVICQKLLYNVNEELYFKFKVAADEMETLNYSILLFLKCAECVISANYEVLIRLIMGSWRSEEIPNSQKNICN